MRSKHGDLKNRDCFKFYCDGNYPASWLHSFEPGQLQDVPSIISGTADLANKPLGQLFIVEYTQMQYMNIRSINEDSNEAYSTDGVD